MTVQLRVVPNPSTMRWQDWVDTVVGYNRGLINQTSANLGWEEFADRLGQIIPQAPSPRMFDDWRAWADALRRIV